MQVIDVLNKITERNAPVVGCVARSGEQLFHNLEDFDLDCAQIADTIDELLALTSYLEDEDDDCDTVYAQYDRHCVIGQRVGDSTLVAVTDHLQRAGFKKLQVGLSLQSRLLAKALNEAPQVLSEPSTPAAEDQPETTSESSKTDRLEKLKSSLAAAASTNRSVGEEPEPTTDEPEVAAEPDVVAQSDGEPLDQVIEEPVEEPVEKPKVRRVYRGTVYWE